MLREEAEREADRRNREDPDRERFEFYAFDESAGLSAEAWDVAARLRQGPRTDRPATAAALLHPDPPPAEATAYEETAPAGPPHEAPHHEAPHHEAPHHEAPPYEAPHHEVPHDEAPHHEAPSHEAPHHEAPHHEAPHQAAAFEEAAYEEALRPETPYEEVSYAEHVEAVRAPEPAPARGERKADEDRPGVFVRTVGAVVIVVGLLWMALVVALAVLLEPDDATTFAVYLGGAVLGLLAIALGVAIRRS